MNTHTIHTPFPTGDRGFARAARRVSAHPRAAATPAPAVTPAGCGNPAPAAHPSTSSPATEARILRRWSVAELIARATAGAPVVA